MIVSRTRQLALLVTYAPLCAVGGRLIYATCTIVEEENEKVIERFLAERDDFVLMPVKEIWGRERAEQVGDALALRLFPHRHDTDGFFAAVLRRVRSGDYHRFADGWIGALVDVARR